MDKHRHAVYAVAWMFCWAFAFDLMDDLGLSPTEAMMIFAPGWLPLWWRVITLAGEADNG